MNEPYILNNVRLPARVDNNLAAQILGVQVHDISILVAEKIIRPLGKPRINAPKYFSSNMLLELSKDVSFLNKMQLVLQNHWRIKNHSSDISNE
jgi:hypothetical protein